MRCKSITSTSPQSIQSHSRSRNFPREGQLEEGENKTKTEGATRKAQKLLLAIPSVIFLFLLFSVVWLEIQPFLPSDKYRRPLLILQTVKNRHKVWQLLEFDKWRREISLTVSANAMRNISFISAFLSRPRFQLPRRPLQGTLVFSRLLHDLFRSARRKLWSFATCMESPHITCWYVCKRCAPCVVRREITCWLSTWAKEHAMEVKPGTEYEWWR